MGWKVVHLIVGHLLKGFNACWNINAANLASTSIPPKSRNGVDAHLRLRKKTTNPQKQYPASILRTINHTAHEVPNRLRNPKYGFFNVFLEPLIGDDNTVRVIDVMRPKCRTLLDSRPSHTLLSKTSTCR